MKERDPFVFAAESQNENSKPETRSKKRYYLFENEPGQKKLAQLRAETLKALGAYEYEDDRGKTTQLKRLSVCLPDGTLMPKIEYLMDVLGPAKVSQRLKEKNFTYWSSKGLSEYEKWLDEQIEALLP